MVLRFIFLYIWPILNSYMFCLAFRTALHWAAKRNHLDVAHFLLTNGADKTMESFAKEIPADLTTSPALLNLLGSPKIRISPKSEENESSPSFTPSYLSQPNMGYQPITDYEPIVNKSIPFSTSGEYKLSRGINLHYCSFLCLVTTS